MNEQTRFFEIMEMANDRLKARRNNSMPRHDYSDVLKGCLDIASATNNLETLKEAALWAPSNGMVVDLEEDLSSVPLYSEQLINNLDKEKTR